MKVFVSILFLLILIIVVSSVLQVKTKEPYIDSSNTCYDWIIHDGPQQIKDRVLNLNPSDSNDQNLSVLLKAMDASKNMLITDQENKVFFGSPCILTTTSKIYHNVNDMSCKDLGFDEECLYHIETLEDLEGLRSTASNFYYFANRENIKTKNVLEEQDNDETEKLVYNTSENVTKKGIYNSTFQTYNTELEASKNLVKQKEELEKRFSEVSQTSVIQNTLQQTQQQLQSVHDVSMLFSDNTGVILFDQTNFQGNPFPVNVGSYNTKRDIKSVKISNGFTLTLYEQPNFSGRSLIIKSNVKSVQDLPQSQSWKGSWTHNISSFTITKEEMGAG